MEAVVEKLRKIEAIIKDGGEIMREDADYLQKTLNIVSSEKLEKQFTAITDENRLLTIGIIGRVKAGKSSVTNALFFNGQSILPEAATPMTAALTILSCAEQSSVTARFFSKDEIDVIRREHGEYEKTESEAIKQRKISSFEQYEQIKASGLDADEYAQAGKKSIAVANERELHEKLQDFVGSSGRYMPFTQSVELELNHKALQDICIVDTPGINDPIKSREARTEEYLRKCDVVFIISPAGGFITQQDLELMDRLSAREGVNEVYLVASMADYSIMARSELNKSKGNLKIALDGLRERLSSQAAAVIKSLKNQHPEIGGQFDKLADDIENRFLLTSSICHAMSQSYDKHENWTENMKKIWALLSEHYPSFFDDSFSSSGKANLDFLSGIEPLHERINAVRAMKDKIIADKTEQYRTGQNKVVQTYHGELGKLVVERINRINSSDLQKIDRKQKELKRVIETGSDAAETKLRDTISRSQRQLKQKLDERIHRLTSKVSQETDANTGERTEKVNVPGFIAGVKRFFGFFTGSDGGTETVTTTELRVGAVKRVINDELTRFNNEIEATVSEELDRIKSELPSEIKKEIAEFYTDAEKDLLDAAFLHRAVNLMIRDYTDAVSWDFPAPVFNYHASGVIAGKAIENFSEAWYEFKSGLATTYSGEIKTLFRNIESRGANKKPAAFIFADLEAQLKNLQNDLKEKTETLKKLKEVQQALEAVA